MYRKKNKGIEARRQKDEEREKLERSVPPPTYSPTHLSTYLPIYLPN